MTRMPVGEMSATAPRKSIAESGSSTTTSIYLRKRRLYRLSESLCSSASAGLPVASVITYFGSGKIQRKDVARRSTSERHSSRTPLAHPYPVPETTTFDEHGRLRLYAQFPDQKTAQDARADAEPKGASLHQRGSSVGDEFEGARASAGVLAVDADALQASKRRDLRGEALCDRGDRDRGIPAKVRRCGARSTNDALEVGQRRSTPRVAVGFRMP